MSARSRQGRTGIALGAAVLGLLAAGEGRADPARGWFVDGARRVEVERGTAVLDERGRLLAPVVLSYPGRVPVHGFVDRTAIVQIDAGGLDGLARASVRPLQPLMPSIGLWLVEDAAGAGDGLDLAQRLAAAPPPGVRQAIPNLYYRQRTRGEPYVPNDPQLGGQWYFENLGMEEAWGLSKGDPGQTIVVIDTGCDLVHPDLASKMDPGKDVVDGDDDPTFDVAMAGSEHGTACAGLAAAATDNGEGIAGGCPECRLRCVRMLSDKPTALSVNIAAFQFALDVDAAVVSNSWGFVDPTPVPQALADAIDEVFDHGRSGKGAMVLFAAGNDARQLGDDEMEAVRGVLCVGAINNNDEQTPFTNSGNALDVVAPTGTLSTDISGPEGASPDDYTKTFGGTSSSCPVVAGISGLLTSAAPEWTSTQFYDLLVQTARPAPFAQPDANGHDLVYGYGIVDPLKALQQILGGEPPPPDAGAHGVDPPPADEESGCSCRAAGAPSGDLARWLVVAAGLALGQARRRRRR